MIIESRASWYDAKLLVGAQRLAVVLACALCIPLAPMRAQDARGVERVLRLIADSVSRDGTFQLVDSASGRRYERAADTPDQARLTVASRYTDWRYWNGVLNIAMLRLTDVMSEPSYAAFARRNVAFSFEAAPYFERRYRGEDKWSYPFGEQFIMAELDDYGAMGASVIDVYSHDRDVRYRNYVDRAAAYATSRQSRLEDGTFVRSFPRRWTLWADDLYMSVPFLARMAVLTGDRRYFDDAARQVISYHRYLFDERAGLMTHEWYSDVQRRGIAFWGRANGWAIVAQVELLDRLPNDHPQRDTLLVLLRKHLLGIARYQSPQGLWHQLLDRDDSYLETSASAMFTYAFAHAVNRGWMEPRYASIARRGWEGVASRIRPDGLIEGICTGTVVSDNLADYYNRPAPLNDVHGIGTVLLAGGEILRLVRSSRP